MNYGIVACASSLLLLCAACGSAPKEEFYTLGDGAPLATGSLPSLDYGVMVGPVSMPDVVDRPQFVLRMTGSQVRIAEQVRWAEPLKQSIPRAVAANLAHGLGNARVSAQGGGETREPDFRVLLDVQRFESTLAQGATLELVWTVRRTKTREETTGRASVYEAAPGAGYQPLVDAHSRAIAAVSRNIADALRALRGKDTGADSPAPPAALTGAR